MNCKDLMLGNWVYDGDITKFPMYVVTVGNDYVYLNFEGNEGDVWECLDDDITPIPVTADILKRIGFREKKGIYPRTFYRYFDEEYRYKLDVDPVFCNSDRKWGIHIDNGDCCTIGSGEFTYVHELQNLVRCISGHSLPITKEMIYGNTNE